MASLITYQESKEAMLMLETQQRAIRTKTTANGDTSAREPPSSLINPGGARFHQHLPPPYHHGLQPKEQCHQPYHYLKQPLFSEDNIQGTPVRKPTSSSSVLVHEDTAALSACVGAPTFVAPSNVSSDGADDIRKCGYLRKQKHGHKRFFVLRGPSHLGSSRLEYYDSEKKFRNTLRSAAAASPKRVIYLYQCFTVNKRADSKNKHLIALYTKDEYFPIVAENEQEQEDWFLALSDLMSEGKRGLLDAEELDDMYGAVSPCTVFKEVWQVNVKPKGLGQTKNLTGVYRLCLSAKTLHLVKLNSETPCVNLQLMNIRRCGHSECFFFIEVGRSSSTGPGEIWMQVDDSVVAQSMHETILETMKALKAFAEFRPRSKSQSSGSNPVAFVTTTRRHLGNLPPSQTGLQRRSRTDSVAGTPLTGKGGTAICYRFRTSSEGEGTMRRPFRSVTGSLVHLNGNRASLSRQARAASGSSCHARSASLPVSHLSSAASPISVSSSSGHGSASDTLTRPSSGSPSDGGFNSSDEYGSSPADLRYFWARSSTPDSLANTPPIREETCLGDYMGMGQYRESLGFEDGDEKYFWKRTHSTSRPTGGTGGMQQKTTQTTSSLDESVSSTCSQCTACSERLCQTAHPVCSDQQRFPPEEAGYVAMIPCTVPSRSGDYMPMTPEDSHGYMVMLPGGPRGRSDCAENGGEYVNMSQTCATAPCQPPDQEHYAQTCPETPCSYGPYFSLPRSYKAPARQTPAEHDEYMPMSSPARLTPSGDERRRRSPSCDHPVAQRLHLAACEVVLPERGMPRPNCLALVPEAFGGGSNEIEKSPISPGELRDGCTQAPSAEGLPSSSLSSGGDYWSLEKGSRLLRGHSLRPSLVAPWNPPAYIRPLAGAGGGMDLYAEMRSPSAMLRHLCVMEQQNSSCLPPVVFRAEPTGRRRHSSDTSSSPPDREAGPCTADSSRRQSSASFDSVWLRVAGDDAAAGRLCRDASSGCQNGLDYMALDLSEDLWATPTPHAASRTYADIDFPQS